MEDFRKQFIEILMEMFCLDEKEITVDSHLKWDLGLDSIDITELIMKLETQFSIAIPYYVAEQFNTVGDAEKYIKDKLKSKNNIKHIHETIN